MQEIRPVPKPKKRRRGRSIRRNKDLVVQVHQRDGTCLYGVTFQDGCVEGMDAAHIKSWGGPEGGRQADTLENMIGLCRKHHRMHEDGFISDVTLQLLLYHWHGYGPEPWLARYLQFIRSIAQDHGLSRMRCLSKDGRNMTCELMGARRQVRFTLSFDTLRTVNPDTVLEMIRAHIITALRRNGA